MAPVVVTTTSGEQDDSFSFFSPTSSTAAGTPSNNYNSNYNHNSHSPLTPAGFRMRRSTGTSGSGSRSGIHPTSAGATDNDVAASGMELHVDWDPAILHRDLRHATTVLNHRGLKLAAKWTAEQWMGLPPSVVASSSEDMSSSSIDSSSGMTPQDWYAKTLMDVGEYLHAAYVLSATTTTTNHNDTTQSSRNNTTPRHQHPPMDDVLSMPPPAPHSTSFGMYLRAYALYMAGERRKEEEHLELQRYVHEERMEGSMDYTSRRPVSWVGVEMFAYFHSLSRTHTTTIMTPAVNRNQKRRRAIPTSYNSWTN
jgi:Anaphase promoting complex subunit 8 / Cdc23